MTSVDGITGVGLYLKFGSTVLSGNYRTFNSSEEVDMVEKSAGSDTAKTYLTRLEDGTADASFVLPNGTAGTAMWGAVKKGTGGTLEWGEEGTGSSKPKHTVYAIVSSRAKETPYNDLIIANVKFQFSGAVTDEAYPA